MNNQTIRNPLFFSAALHGLCALALFWMMHTNAAKPHQQPLWIEVEPSTPLQVQKKHEMNDDKFKRIVNTQIVNPTLDAAKNAFLGEKNQIVERQTSNRETAVQKPGQMAKVRTEQPKAISQASPRGQINHLKDLGLAILPENKPGARMGNRPADAPVWAEEGSNAKDYIKGIQETERTLLNTKEFTFFGYFQRIRERLELAWHPLLKDHIAKIYQHGRTLASDIEHLTRVMVTLSSEGEVVRVQVMEESGVTDLDSAAIEAFNHAGPFPNPPKGLIDNEGKVEIRWDFVLKT